MKLYKQEAWCDSCKLTYLVFANDENHAQHLLSNYVGEDCSKNKYQAMGYKVSCEEFEIDTPKVIDYDYVLYE